MSYIVSFFAAFHRPTRDQRYRSGGTRSQREQTFALYYSPISPRII